MTWSSGTSRGSAGECWVSTDAYPEPVRISDAEVRVDEAERVLVALDETAGFPPVEHGLHEPTDVDRDRELFVRVAETHPGIVRTLSVLIGELADVDLEPAVLRGLGQRVERVGSTLIMRADRVVIEASPNE